MMFESLAGRAARAGTVRARDRAAALAERIRGEAPKGIEVAVVNEGVQLSGPDLDRRWVLDSRFRQLLAGLR